MNKRPANSIIPWLVFGIAGLFYFYGCMLRVSPSVMASQLMQSFHLHAEAFGTLSADFYYIYIPMQLLVGLLMDRYGPKRLLALGAFISSFGIYLFASSISVSIADFGRFMIGFGSSFAFVVVLKIATIWLPVNRFALIAGSSMAIGVLGGIAGDFVFSALISLNGWEWACYYMALNGLLITFLILLFVKDENQYLTTNAEFQPLSDFKTVFEGLICLIKKPGIWINGLIGCLLYLPIAAFAESWEIPFLKNAGGFSHTQAVFAASMIFLGWAVGGPIVGLLSDIIKQRRLPITVGAVVSAILVSYILYVPNLSHSVMYVLFFVMGIFSSAQAIVFSVCREISPPNLAGTAIGFTNMLIMLSGISVFLVGFLLDHLGKHLYSYSLTNYQFALAILPIGAVLAVFLTFFLPETYCKMKKQ